jgi:hypothetical protein
LPVTSALEQSSIQLHNLEPSLLVLTSDSNQSSIVNKELNT